MIKFSKKSLPTKRDLQKYKELLPCFETMQWLSFMVSLNLTINQDMSNPKVQYKLKNSGKLRISFEKKYIHS